MRPSTVVFALALALGGWWVFSSTSTPSSKTASIRAEQKGEVASSASNLSSAVNAVMPSGGLPALDAKAAQAVIGAATQPGMLATIQSTIQTVMQLLGMATAPGEGSSAAAMPQGDPEGLMPPSAAAGASVVGNVPPEMRKAVEDAIRGGGSPEELQRRLQAVLPPGTSLTIHGEMPGGEPR